jgi:hypothetical protein
VGGIVVMRIGSNALQVIQAVEREIATLRLPDGVRLIPTYDRSDLILGSIATLKDTLMQQAIIVTLICLVFLFHARSALVVMLVLPLAVLLSFIAIRYLGLTSNIMSLGGIAIAIGELAEAALVMIENPPGRHADHHQLPADLHAGRSGRTPVHAAGLHEDLRDVRRRHALDHAGAAADGAAAEGTLPHGGEPSGQPDAQRTLPAGRGAGRPPPFRASTRALCS